MPRGVGKQAYDQSLTRIHDHSTASWLWVRQHDNSVSAHPHIFKHTHTHNISRDRWTLAQCYRTKHGTTVYGRAVTCNRLLQRLFCTVCNYGCCHIKAEGKLKIKLVFINNLRNIINFICEHNYSLQLCERILTPPPQTSSRLLHFATCYSKLQLINQDKLVNVLCRRAQSIINN